MDDDYVAQVLAKEARDSSQKYSTDGLGAYMPRKPAGNAPKPNTRFLRHLIKETDNHNTALKRKEEREAKDKMRSLRQQSMAASESMSPSSRRLGRTSNTRDSVRSHQDREDQHRSHRRRDRSRSTSKDRDRERSRRHRHREEQDRDSTRHDRHDRSERREHRKHDSSRTSRRHRDEYSRYRSRSPRRDRDRDRDRDRASKSHRSERSRRTESPAHTRSSHSHRANRDSEHSERHSGRNEHASSGRLSPPQKESQGYKSSSTTTPRPEDPESDPLEELVGPLPATDTTPSAPIRSRGRGAYKSNTSNIDAHFASDYDPTTDIQPDEDEDSNTKQSSRRHVPGLMTGEDDWDMALEALRDRAKWKQKGEDRLRAAGINEEAIDRWKSEPAFAGTNGERRPEDVRWSKTGEGREWDRGKFVDDEGHIDTRASWFT